MRKFQGNRVRNGAVIRGFWTGIQCVIYFDRDTLRQMVLTNSRMQNILFFFFVMMCAQQQINQQLGTKICYQLYKTLTSGYVLTKTS